jgi:hypothetical protein
MKKGIELINVLALSILIILVCLIGLNIELFRPNVIRKVHIINTCTSYEAAINQAVKDVDCGKKYILLIGMLDITDEEWQFMVEQENRFGFKFVFWGCVGPNRYINTYDQIMRRTINEMAHKYIFRTVDKYTLEANQKRRKY